MKMPVAVSKDAGAARFYNVQARRACYRPN